MDKPDNQCEHASCTCMKAPESDYCGPYCEGAKDKIEVFCGCGHPGCRSAAAVA